jgi:SAM-dependent methyltransferase
MHAAMCSKLASVPASICRFTLHRFGAFMESILPWSCRRWLARGCSDRQLRFKFFAQSAEETLPLSDESIDTIVITWTLCSILDPTKALRQIRRVLKPDGRLIFVEHGRATDSKIAAWQDRLTPFWKRVGGGCHLNRKVDALLVEAGFAIEELRTTYLPGPKPMTFTYQGFARTAL